MMNKNRRWRITDVATLEELAEKLIHHSWCLCTGFRVIVGGLGGRDELLALNDAFSEDGAQEFAILRNGVQVESLTASWYPNTDRDGRFRERDYKAGEIDLLSDLRGIASGGIKTGFENVKPSSILPHPDGSCPACA